MLEISTKCNTCDTELDSIADGGAIYVNPCWLCAENLRKFLTLHRSTPDTPQESDHESE